MFYMLYGFLLPLFDMFLLYNMGDAIYIFYIKNHEEMVDELESWNKPLDVSFLEYVCSHHMVVYWLYFIRCC